MKYHVRLTAKAEADIDAALRWFQDNQAIASGRRWFAKLIAKIDTLESFPERCAIATESVDLDLEIRELIFGKRTGVYRILFQIDAQTVQILHVRHSARDQFGPEEI